MGSSSFGVLLLAYYYPPATGIASERMVGFHRHLPSFGIKPLILAPRNPHFHQASGENGEDPPSVIRTGSLELSRLLRRGLGEPASSSTVTPVSTAGPGRALRGLVRELLYVPDAQIGWVPFAIRTGARALEQDHERDWIIYSSSVPYSAHLAAAHMSSRFRLPWVAEFRDPWSAQDESQLPRNSFRRKLDRRLEGWILRTAHQVVVTAEATRDLLLASFPNLAPRKVTVILNGFDPLPPGKPPAPKEAMTLVHAGTLHDPQYARPVVEVLRRIHARWPGAVRLVVLGDPVPWLDCLLGDGDPVSSSLDLRGIVHPSVAREATNDASALVLPATHRRFRLILLGKLFTYLGSRRPILAAVPEGSEMESVIQQAGDGRLMSAWNAETIERHVLHLLEEHRDGHLQGPRVPEESVRAFTREARAGELAQLLQEVLANRRRG